MQILLPSAIFLTVFAVNVVQSNTNCIQKLAEYGLVCLCNSTDCDSVPPILNSSEDGFYQQYVTSKTSPGFKSTTGLLKNETASTPYVVTIKSRNDTQQTIMGFGGAFTGSASYAIMELSEITRVKILESYFGENGIRYTFGRVPIATTDFALSGQTYCDVHDETLDSFALGGEDLNFKIPVIKEAFRLRGGELKLFAASWTSPSWMKAHDNMEGNGTLKEKYYALWSQYYVKFFEAYAKHDIQFWGTSTQNEPFNSSPPGALNLKFNISTMNKWHSQYFGPTIRNSSFKHLKILINDDNFIKLPMIKSGSLSNKDVVKYTDGVSVHWYTKQSERTDDMFTNYPENVFLLATEACEGVYTEGVKNNVELGNWNRAEDYINDIIYDLEHNFVGWVEWNLALNTKGGPSWVNGSLDSPIITNVTNDEFYKQPMFYVIGHFSKTVVPNSKKLKISTSAEFADKGLKAIAFLRPDEKIVLVVYNGANETVTIQANILSSTEVFNFAPNSINTLLVSNVK